MHISGWSLIKPWRMCEGYSSHVFVSVTALAATYLVYMSKMRQHTVSCRLLKILWRLGSLTKNTLVVLDTITNGIVYEMLAKSDNILN